MKFTLIFGVLLVIFGASQACRCPPLEEPAMCRTKYLMLVKITGVKVEAPLSHTYSFELLRDISYPAAFKTTFTQIRTGYDSASCYLELEVGKYYLLGGYPDTKTQTLSASTCNTYWKEWTLDPLVDRLSEVMLTKTEQKCREFHEKNQI